MMDVLKLQFAMALVSFLAQMSESSLYDPRLFPEEGPFLEGWYLRIIDFDNGDSARLMFGHVLPDSQATPTEPLVFASIIRHTCTASGVCRIVSVNGKFDRSDLGITVNGQEVSMNPDLTSPPNFRWEVDDGTHGGYLDQQGDDTIAVFRLEDIVLTLIVNEPYPWNSAGTGPEGNLVNLDIPLHWFVFSLRSNLVEYEIQNLTSGVVTGGSNGVVHMEKNWGTSFPMKWIWSEGVLNDDTGALFALSGGKVDFSVWPTDAYMMGYRNPDKGLDLNFRPTDSSVSVDVNGCSGTVHMTINTWSYRVHITLEGNRNTFNTGWYGPDVSGFPPQCVQNYNATAHIKVYKKRFWSSSLLDEQTFLGAALEFGGTNVCENDCAGI